MTQPLGTIAEEAARLAAAAQGWLQQHLGDPEHLATGAPECTVCPVCRFIALLRGEHPEVADRIADAGWALISALRGLLDGTQPAQTPPSPDPRVQHIDLGP